MSRGPAAILVGCLLLAGCGIPTDRTPRAVATVSDDLAGTPSPPPDGTARLSATVYLVDGKDLVPVRRPLAVPVGAVALITAIAAGPTQTEQARGLRTALSSPLDVKAASVDRSGHLSIDLEGEPAGAGATEQVLAFGQVVLSLITLPSIRSVQFRVGRQPLPVPRGDGSLTTDPLTQDDYSQLLAGATATPTT
jgi:hypothetical protein